MFLKSKRPAILNQVGDLVQNSTISPAERQLLLAAQKGLASGHYDEQVAQQLKRQLSVLAMNRHLTPAMTSFFIELSRQYLGYGQRGMVSLS
ncbi:bacteriocin immunity protein [Lactiplantibacillus daoliensis]|uniref:Bacteriocin immunity protein n=1 Tax=Lactiplantibacillus daoliensis TaxID=2559916 RepID=A0ABW1UCM7_9LACO|nr:bacteriocin immunity protein [Lactiplantibacillus daoliensis]